MEKQLLLGAEAAALGAIDAGISGVYAYPGTPSTEITEFIQHSPIARKRGVLAAWSANEKTAYEEALGMSYAGKRVLVCMKHVGLNVAADAFINSALTGIEGGLVLAIADDPSMHSSQNEQDSRVYGKFAMIPVIEPSNQQELYDGVRHAFQLSESLSLPVMVRLTTRLSHSRAGVVPKPSEPERPLSEAGALPSAERFVLMPVNARKQYARLIGLQRDIEQLAEGSWLNRMVEGTASTGVLAFGIAYNYVMEVRETFGMDFPVLKTGQYPLPHGAAQQLFEQCDSVLVAEEGYPVMEELLRGFFGNDKVRGRLDGTLARTGELNTDIIARALGLEPAPTAPVPKIVVPRPPELCRGCGHRDLYLALNAVMAECPHQHVFSDIGCYTLGALPPFSAIHTCVDMGASVTMAIGAAEAGLRPAVAVIGDSTFTHSGMTGLLDAVNRRSAVTIIITDNDTTAMTGGQDSAATGSRLEAICIGLGVEPRHLRTIVPLKPRFEENIAVLKEEIAYEGVSVILARRECVEQAAKRNRNS
ncbi:MAG: indolepyruvate ferredoxin oxidoreductase [Pelodictyon luteolum]|uniref:Indolepyruvate oxidoreductase subunit IorA n=1 Tax=Pelodictyon luteolum TaxID=1100 RepID=A0A165M9U5_PELLU|nr:thiamine pyrophosphate-dependent enzyme [Pelodictyon luteolum]KZK74988.1 MAG: indolepyruvate ferredoxin oxidoreductase [Pelodictyon luteolum]